MKVLAKYSILFSLLIYFSVWLILKPFLGYILDSDGVAYLTIARRVAEGDYLKSINGLWSPMNSWLLVPFIRQGYDVWQVSIWINFFFGGLVLILSDRLFAKFELQSITKLIANGLLAFLMTYYVYFQMFADVLQLVFVLCYLNILFAKNFRFTNWRVALLGIIMGIAFYAKAYSFLFFGVHFFVVLIQSYRNGLVQKMEAIRYYSLGIFSMFLMVLPWILALHLKYHEWSITGHAGKLNMSWNILSAKSFKDDIGLLIPPSYQDSPSFWEDPYLSQSNLSTPFSSLSCFLKWILRVGHTLLNSVICFQELSFFAISILLLALYLFFIKSKTINLFEHKVQLLCMTILTLPLGYLMMHIETRYIWLNAILLILICSIIFEKYASVYLKKNQQLIMVSMVVFSFMLFPLMQVKQLKYKNKSLFELAAQLNSHRIHGKFTSNIQDAGNMWVIAYLSKNQFYTIEKTTYTELDLMNELKKYSIDFYIFQYEGGDFNLNLGEENLKKYFPYQKRMNQGTIIFSRNQF